MSQYATLKMQGFMGLLAVTHNCVSLSVALPKLERLGFLWYNFNVHLKLTNSYIFTKFN